MHAYGNAGQCGEARRYLVIHYCISEIPEYCKLVFFIKAVQTNGMSRRNFLLRKAGFEWRYVFLF